MTTNPRFQPVSTEFEVLATRNTRSSPNGCLYGLALVALAGPDGAGCLTSALTPVAGSAAFTISRKEVMSRSG